MSEEKIDNRRYYLERGIDLDNRIIYLDDEIVPDVVGVYVRAIQIMESADQHQAITIYFNSPGGDVYSGLSLYDKISQSPCEINTICSGIAMSMGLILFLAGDNRSAFPHATFMAHSLSSMSGGKLQDMTVDLVENQRLNAILIDILVETTNKTKKWWTEEIKHEDKYYSVKQAKKLGILK
jgi:ATP-dependent Clp protease protease subunit